jgi:CDP-4-dehydro-6-deoxyglucose reductase, E1
MRGGMLIACHHGLSREQMAHIHDSFRAVAGRVAGKASRVP